MQLYYDKNDVKLFRGDCLEVLPQLPEASADAVVTDPPYGLGEPRSKANQHGAPRSEEDKTARRSGFMGLKWDKEVPGVECWEAVLRVLKPAGYMLCFGGTRTYHRLTCAVEDAGFEVRDCLMWLHGQGFPKGKGCLKPAWEPILLARKPGAKVLPLGIDECRIGTEVETWPRSRARPATSSPIFTHKLNSHSETVTVATGPSPSGRWPANVILDEESATLLDEQTRPQKSGGTSYRRPPATAKTKNVYGTFNGPENPDGIGSSAGTVSRFFYCAKATRAERGPGNKHPTVKPLALVLWLVRLITPKGGTVFDPFAGSGTTLLAAKDCDVKSIGIEMEQQYCDIAVKRLEQGVLLFEKEGGNE